MSPEELEKARADLGEIGDPKFCDCEVRAQLAEALAEIERLRLLATFPKSESGLISGLCLAIRKTEEQAARIKELDGMLDARSKEIVGRIQECQACQIDQLRAEGKIGPEDAKPRSWQMEERKAALSRACDALLWIDRTIDSDNQKHIDVLRDMLDEHQ